MIRHANYQFDYSASSINVSDPHDRSVLERIGPCSSIHEVAGTLNITFDSVCARAAAGALIGIQIDYGDRISSELPDFQFHQFAGDDRVTVCPQIVKLWPLLPTTGWGTGPDLAAWMNTRFTSLAGGKTPAQWACLYGIDEPRLTGLLQRLHWRYQA